MHMSVYIGLMILPCFVILAVIFVLRYQKVKKGIQNYISLKIIYKISLNILYVDPEPEFNETENVAYGVIEQIQIEIQAASTSRHCQPNYVNIQYSQ